MRSSQSQKKELADFASTDEYVPTTKRDAFQDLNASFNLSLPLHWFMPDTDRITSFHNLSENFSKERKNLAEGTYLSQFDLCFVWELSENTECCIPCCNSSEEMVERCFAN